MAVFWPGNSTNTVRSPHGGGKKLPSMFGTAMPWAPTAEASVSGSKGASGSMVGGCVGGCVGGFVSGVVGVGQGTGGQGLGRRQQAASSWAKAGETTVATSTTLASPAAADKALNIRRMFSSLKFRVAPHRPLHAPSVERQRRLP